MRILTAVQNDENRNQHNDLALGGTFYGQKA